MDDTRYRTVYASLGMTQASVARLVGVDARTSRRWALGDKNVPYDVALLLELMMKFKVTPDEARSLAELPPADKEADGPLALLMLAAIVVDRKVPMKTLRRLANSRDLD